MNAVIYNINMTYRNVLAVMHDNRDHLGSQGVLSLRAAMSKFVNESEPIIENHNAFRRPICVFVLI